MSTKQAFKKYLEQKKQATQNLTKLEQNELQRLEEDAVIKRVMKRERYATDPEFRMKQQDSARKTMAKNRAQKTELYCEPKFTKKPVKYSQPVDDEIEVAPEEEEQEEIQPKGIFNPRNLF